MFRPRARPATLFAALLLPSLLLFPACVSDHAGDELAIEIPETEAGTALGAALAEARSTDRLVFVHSGADW